MHSEGMNVTFKQHTEKKPEQIAYKLPNNAKCGNKIT